VRSFTSRSSTDCIVRLSRLQLYMVLYISWVAYDGQTQNLRRVKGVPTCHGKLAEPCERQGAVRLFFWIDVFHLCSVE